VRRDDDRNGAPSIATTRAELRALAGLLDEVLELADDHPILRGGARGPDGEATVAGQTAATRADYEYARELVHDLAARWDDLTPDERRRLDLNADRVQFHFHLDEELRAQRGDVRPEVLDRSLTFLKRHIVRLRAEYEEERHLRLPDEDRELSVRLAELVRDRYESDLAAEYAAVGYRRPFVDKFYRDYALDGIPDGLLLALDRIARDRLTRDGSTGDDSTGDDSTGARRVDVVVCVLKGGLPFTVLLELLGWPRDRIAHLMVGRASGSHYGDARVFRPLDFALEDLAGRSVLVVENNLATGRTLTEVVGAIASAGPAQLGIFLDYVITDLGGLDAGDLATGLGADLDEVLVGPWPPVDPASADGERVQAVRRVLLDRLRALPARRSPPGRPG